MSSKCTNKKNIFITLDSFEADEVGPPLCQGWTNIIGEFFPHKAVGK